MPEPSSGPSQPEEKQQLTIAKLDAAAAYPDASHSTIDDSSTSSPSLPPQPAPPALSPRSPRSPRSPLPQTSEQLIKPSTAATALMSGSTQQTAAALSASLDQSIPPPVSASLPSSSFDSLRTEFNGLLSQLWHDRSDSSLERFKSEYDKLLSVIRRHQDNEKRLINKCRELNGEIVNNATKIQTALRLSFQDQANIHALKSEVEKAWKVVDGGAERDKRNREIVNGLKNEVVSLRDKLKESEGLNESESEERTRLLGKNEQLSTTIAQLSTQQSETGLQIDSLNQLVGSMEADKLRKDKDILLLKEKYATQKTETQRHFRKCERLSNELMTLKETNDKKQTSWNEKEKEMNELKDKYDGLMVEVQTLQYSNAALSNENGLLKNKYDEAEKLIYLMKEKEHEMYGTCEQLNTEMRKWSSFVKQKDGEIVLLNKKIVQLEKSNQHTLQQKQENDRYKEWLKDEMKQVLKKMDGFAVQAEGDELIIRELQGQLKKLSSLLSTTVEKCAVQSGMMAASEQVNKQLEQDVLAMKQTETQLRMGVYKLEKEKERESLKCNGWYAKCKEKEEFLKLKAMEIHELQKTISDEKSKLKLQQTLYEQVRNDRNLFSRQQINSEDEINEMRRKFNIMSHQIQQLKEEIVTKDSALINEHFVLKRLMEECKMLKRKLNKRKEMLLRAEEVMSGQTMEIKQLRKIVTVNEQAEKVHVRQYEEMMQERDMIGSQLIRRNDELALLYEKVRIQASVLKKGEEQYKEKLGTIQQKEVEIAELKRRLSIKIEEARSIQMIKHEIHQLNHQLAVEKSKVKALSEELENPLNVHRWRKLEGSDPVRFDLLQKIQILQKRLIQQTEATVEAAQTADEQRKLYEGMKEMLARQPGPEVVEVLSKYERGEREKSKQMRAMCAEMNMLNAQVAKLKWDNEKLEVDKVELRKKMMEMKKRYEAREQQQQLQEEKQQDNLTTTTTAATMRDPFNVHQDKFFATQPRITGGGFNLSTTVPAATAATGQ